MITMQNQQAEIEFFNSTSYDRFTDVGYRRILDRFYQVYKPGIVLEVGCGTGAFSSYFYEKSEISRLVLNDISPIQMGMVQDKFPSATIIPGNFEDLDIGPGCFDSIFFGDVLHHFPNLSLVARKTYEILKPGGMFFAFDPYRWNPLFWTYRDKYSPLRSSKGVTANERILSVNDVFYAFGPAGFSVQYNMLNGVKFKNDRLVVRFFNAIESWIWPKPWLISWGKK